MVNIGENQNLLSAIGGHSSELFQAQPNCCMLIVSFHIFVMCLM
jgi:hypothetical protein